MRTDVFVSSEEALLAWSRLRLGHVLNPWELKDAAPPCSCHAEQLTFGFQLKGAEYKDAQRSGIMEYVTARVLYGSALFAVLMVETQQHAHLGILDLANPWSLRAVREAAHSGTIAIQLANGQRHLQLTSHAKNNPFAAVMESLEAMPTPQPVDEWPSGLGWATKAAYDSSLFAYLGLDAPRKAVVVHFLVPESIRADMEMLTAGIRQWASSR